MSLKTVNTHLHNLRTKLGVHSTLEAVAVARSQLSRAPAHLPGSFAATAGGPGTVRRDLPGKSATS
jgi:hypothetical protein